MDRRSRAVAALCTVQFVDVLGVTVVITALPVMLAELRAPASSAGVLVTAYAMFFGGLLMLGARAGDRYGHRRVLLAGLAGFGLASVLAATAGSVAMLAAARCLQGGAAAASVPSGLRLLSAVAGDETSRRRALAAWSATGAAAGASGFLVGGVVTDLAGWRALFWACAPLAAALAVAILRTVPAKPRETTDPLDAAGATLLTAAVMGLVLGASLLERPAHRGAGAAVVAAAVVVLAAFAWIERHVAAPLLPAAAAGHPRLRAAAAVSFLNTATTTSAMTLVTLHLQHAAGVSPSAAGLRLLPFSVGVVAGSTLSAPALDRRTLPAVIALGLGTIAAGDAALLLTSADGWAQPAGVAVAGVGIGLSSVAATTLGTGVAATLQGTASGLLNTAAQLGSALGVAALLLIAALV